MLEHFNDYISITLLFLILFIFIYIMFKLIFKTIEKSRIRKEMDAIENRKED